MPQDPGYYLTPEDRQVLDRFLSSESRRHRGRQAHGEAAGDVDDQEFLAPEVYVARTPAGGIPAMDAGAATASSWTGTGTGTNVPADDVPGRADCYVWFVVRADDGTPTLLPVAADALEVLNLSAAAVAGDQWVLVVRDKFGEWWVVTGGGGGAGVDVCGSPADATTGTGTDAGGDQCQECVEDPRLIEDPVLLRFSCDFVVEELPDGDCDAGGTGTGTGTGTNDNPRKTAHVRTRGKTADVSFEVNPVWCPDICDLLTQTLTLCFENGRFTGHVFGDPPECPP